MYYKTHRVNPNIPTLIQRSSELGVVYVQIEPAKDRYVRIKPSIQAELTYQKCRVCKIYCNQSSVEYNLKSAAITLIKHTPQLLMSILSDQVLREFNETKQRRYTSNHLEDCSDTNYYLNGSLSLEEYVDNVWKDNKKLGILLDYLKDRSDVPLLSSNLICNVVNENIEAKGLCKGYSAENSVCKLELKEMQNSHYCPTPDIRWVYDSGDYYAFDDDITLT